MMPDVLRPSSGTRWQKTRRLSCSTEEFCLVPLCGPDHALFVESPEPAHTCGHGVQIEVYNTVPRGKRSEERSELIADVKEAILPTMVSIVATFESEVNGDEATCKIIGEACATADEEFGCCDITVGSVATEINKNAVAEACAQLPSCHLSYVCFADCFWCMSVCADACGCGFDLV